MKLITVIFCALLAPLCVVALPKNNYLESDIYFGLSKDNGKIISDSEFKKFKNTVIIKYFKSGFTIVKGKGEWLSKKIGIVVEPSRILDVVYKPTENNINKVKIVAKKYKSLFNQEAVLVITKKVSVKFY